MTTITVKIDATELLASIRSALPAALDAAGATAVSRLREDLNVPYPPASAPGRPPHRRTGKLRDSLGHVVLPPEPDAVTLRIGATTPYATFLEYGTRKMAARPFLGPRFVQMAKSLGVDVVDRLRAAVAAAPVGPRP